MSREARRAIGAAGMDDIAKLHEALQGAGMQIQQLVAALNQLGSNQMQLVAKVKQLEAELSALRATATRKLPPLPILRQDGGPPDEST